MDIVQNSAEDHFLTLLERIKQNPRLWIGIYCAFSQQDKHDALISDLATLPVKLSGIQQASDKTLKDLEQKAAAFTESTLYRFADGDILFLAKPASTKEHDDVYTLFRTLASSPKSSPVDFISFEQGMMAARKLSDEKFLSRKRIAAYGAMCDVNRIGSVPVRRQQRDYIVALTVEDDRFTATYTAGILGKVCDLVQARTGEEGIIHYVDHAPDVVFLDIHLPGLSGLETLHAIRRIDPEAYVVMASVDAIKNNISIATGHGAAGFLKKPFIKDRLLAMVQKSPFVKGNKIIRS